MEKRCKDLVRSIPTSQKEPYKKNVLESNKELNKDVSEKAKRMQITLSLSFPINVSKEN